MKKIIFILTFIIAITTCSFASDVFVQINGEIINFKDEQGNTVNAQIINNRTMVPMRKIFEVLGATINWDGENRIVTGVKENITIKLQIDNIVATKIVDGKEEEIVLDAAPTIVNDRTMVPLRFIAESLDKQVGWDSSNRTAIIIDYEYFANVLKTRATALYNFLNLEKNYIECNITHNYFDLQNPINNTIFNQKINASISNNVQNIALTITGNDELSREITTEGWNSTSFTITYGDEEIKLTTENDKLIQMLNIKKKNTINKTYKELEINGTGKLKLDQMFEIWAGVKDNELDVKTFNKLKNDFNNLCNLFTTTNVSTTNLNSKSSSIRYSTYNLEYFDLAKLDNFISGNEHLKAYNIVNKIFFKNDILKDVILYDTSNIVINFTVNDTIFKVTIITENNYNEKNEYILELKHL